MALATTSKRLFRFEHSVIMGNMALAAADACDGGTPVRLRRLMRLGCRPNERNPLAGTGRTTLPPNLAMICLTHPKDRVAHLQVLLDAGLSIHDPNLDPGKADDDADDADVLDADNAPTEADAAETPIFKIKNPAMLKFVLSKGGAWKIDLFASRPASAAAHRLYPPDLRPLAPIRSRDPRRIDILVWAIRRGRTTEFIEVLVKVLSDAYNPGWLAEPASPDEFDNPLPVALEMARWDIVGLLMRHGAPINPFKQRYYTEELYLGLNWKTPIDSDRNHTTLPELPRQEIEQAELSLSMAKRLGMDLNAPCPVRKCNRLQLLFDDRCAPDLISVLLDLGVDPTLPYPLPPVSATEFPVTAVQGLLLGPADHMPRDEVAVILRRRKKLNLLLQSSKTRCEQHQRADVADRHRPKAPEGHESIAAWVLAESPPPPMRLAIEVLRP